MAKLQTPKAIVLRNISALYILQLTNYIIPLITLPYLVRQLGSEAYGWLVYATAINFYFVLASDAGINTLAAQKLARLDTTHPEKHRQQAGAIIVNTTALKTLLTLLFAATLWTLIQTVPGWKNHSILLTISFLPVLGSLVFPTWLFQGLQIMHKTMIFAATGRLIATVGLLTLVQRPQDLLMAAALQNSATLLSGLLALPTIMRLPQIQWSPPQWNGIRNHLRESRSLIISEYTLTALANSNVFWVSLFNDKATVGNYAAIEKALRAAATLFQPIIQALSPRIVHAWSHSPGQAPQLLTQWHPKIALLALTVGLLGILFAPTALQLLYGHTIAGHETWGQILSVWLIFHTLNNLNGQWWWSASGRHKAYSWRIVSVTGAQWLLFTLTLGTHNIEAALWTYAATEALMSLLLLWQRHPKP